MKFITRINARGMYHGECLIYYPDGYSMEKQYVNGIRHGKTKFYNPDRKITLTQDWQYGRLITSIDDTGYISYGNVDKYLLDFQDLDTYPIEDITRGELNKSLPPDTLLTEAIYSCDKIKEIIAIQHNDYLAIHRMNFPHIKHNVDKEKEELLNRVKRIFRYEWTEEINERYLFICKDNLYINFMDVLDKLETWGKLCDKDKILITTKNPNNDVTGCIWLLKSQSDDISFMMGIQNMIYYDIASKLRKHFSLTLLPSITDKIIDETKIYAKITGSVEIATFPTENIVRKLRQKGFYNCDQNEGEKLTKLKVKGTDRQLLELEYIPKNYGNWFIHNNS